MAFKICLILYTLVYTTLIAGKPAKDGSSIVVANENELQQLLKNLYRDGKFDIAYSHHEDGPKTHHEDNARIYRHEDHSHGSHHHHDQARHDHQHSEHHRSHKHAEVEENPSLTNIQTLNLFYKKPKTPSGNSYDDDTGLVSELRNNNVARTIGEDVDTVINLLKNIGISKVDNKFGRTTEDDRDNDNLNDENQRTACVGDRCGNDRACVGDRCGIDNDDRACTGDRCGNDNNRNDDNNNRVNCVGDRCGRIDQNNDNIDDNSESNNIAGNVRCFGDACGRANDNDDKRANCVGDRCDRDRDDDDNNNKNIARCSGDKCSIDQTRLRARRLPNGDKHLEAYFKSNAHKIKINDNLDAIVVDLTDLQNSLQTSQANDGDDKDLNVKLIENVDFPNVQYNNDESVESGVSQRDDSDTKPIEAVVLDLSNVQNGLSDQIRGLGRNIHNPLKQLIIDKVRSNNKPNISNRGEAKILSHNEDNNNVYVPKWLLDEIISTSDGLRLSQQNFKNLLPMTSKQKEKLIKATASKNANVAKKVFRRNLDDEVGVPFHLQIEGLGQLNQE